MNECLSPTRVRYLILLVCRSAAQRMGRQTHAEYPRCEKDAKSLVNDLGMDRGVVNSRAASSLRSAESHLLSIRGICPHWMGESGAADGRGMTVGGSASPGVTARAVGKPGGRKPPDKLEVWAGRVSGGGRKAYDC